MTTFTAGNRILRDYEPPEAEVVVPADPPRLHPLAHPNTPTAELLPGPRTAPGGRGTTAATQVLLDHLAQLPGDTWNERWQAFEATTLEAPWRTVLEPNRSLNSSQVYALSHALAHLVIRDAVRPSYQWMNDNSTSVLSGIAHARDPEGMQVFQETLKTITLASTTERQVIVSASHLCAHTGKTIRQIDLPDLLELRDGTRSPTTRSSRGLRSLFSALYEAGWLKHPTGIYPQANKRIPQASIEELVDKYCIRQPQRDVLVEYLKFRATTLDYSSTEGLAYRIVGSYWKDIQDHHPDVKGFAVDAVMIDAWFARRQTAKGGKPAVMGGYDTAMAVRTFYLDISQWAHTDSYWAPFASTSPITRAHVAARQKLKKQRLAVTQQRTREFNLLLPKIIDQAAREKRETAAVLAAATEAEPGAEIVAYGRTWTVSQLTSSSPIRLRAGTDTRDPVNDEEIAFWTWATVEVLRNSAIRIEEMLELTHLSLQPYKVPGTNETIPLLHIAPAKSDCERMVVASPELVSALAEILNRIRHGSQAVPLTQRWDPNEHLLGEPLPHLFARFWARELRVINSGSIRRYLVDLCDRAGVELAGKKAQITPHDFRRIFATDALAAGIPPHIVQAILGHKSITTTMIYAAIYPQDVIRHHRTLIASRRLLRPSEEYREPTAAEWDEFEKFFVQRKVSLGSCGRAYGTNCQHEHACLRCGLLRPDPNEKSRLEDIINNLHDRIEEAEQRNWLGEVEGLQTSLAGAQQKLDQMQRQLNLKPVDLGTIIPVGSGQARDRERGEE